MIIRKIKGINVIGIGPIHAIDGMPIEVLILRDGGAMQGDTVDMYKLHSNQRIDHDVWFKVGDVYYSARHVVSVFIVPEEQADR